MCDAQPGGHAKLRINLPVRRHPEPQSQWPDASARDQQQEAKWLTRTCSSARDDTRVAQAHVDRQRHFFDHGEVAMRPLVQREIAEGWICIVHISADTQNFMLPARDLELKYFFGSHVRRRPGRGIEHGDPALIKQHVTAENSRSP